MAEKCTICKTSYKEPTCSIYRWMDRGVQPRGMTPFVFVCPKCETSASYMRITRLHGPDTALPTETHEARKAYDRILDPWTAEEESFAKIK